MAKLKFQIVTPQRTVLHQEVDSLTCPTQMGQITILPQHIPLIAALQPGELIARVGGRNEHIAVSGGFVEVRPEMRL
jgi:F-type H+-transporting ATPase subunit epsilon